MLLYGKFAPNIVYNSVGAVIVILLRFCISINVGLGIFNLIPLPPLDGSKIVGGFLPYSVRDLLERYYNAFYIIFIAIWITGIAGMVISPIISTITTWLLRLAGAIFGVTVI